MGSPFPLVILIVIFAGPYTVLGQQGQCLAPCVGNAQAPVDGGPPCMCTTQAFLGGCQVAPCGPYDIADSQYVCQCTLEYQPINCVTLRCVNSTCNLPTAPPYPSASSCPSYPPSNYPSTPSSYPASNYPSIPSSYPASNYPSKPSSYSAPVPYPAANYPPPMYPGYNYPAPGYPSSNYPSGSYGSYCGTGCICQGSQPDDCTEDSVPPIIGGPPCACNADEWFTGCSLKKCEAGDTNENFYTCECTAENSPEFCLSPQCSG